MHKYLREGGKMKKEYWWRLTTRDNKSVMFPETPLLSVTCKIGEWVKPKIEGTKLMVFKTRHLAYLFKHDGMSDCSYKIHKCKVRNPKKCVAVLSCSEIFHWLCKNKLTAYKGIKRFWNGDSEFYRSEAPKGSFSCDAVKILD